MFETNKIFKIDNNDKLPTHNNNDIYKCVCSCKQAYVGRTSNNLIFRVDQLLPKNLLNKIRVSNSERKVSREQEIKILKRFGGHFIIKLQEKKDSSIKTFFTLFYLYNF